MISIERIGFINTSEFLVYKLIEHFTVCVRNVQRIAVYGFDIEAIGQTSWVVGEWDHVTLEQVHHGGQVLLQVDDEVGMQLGESSENFCYACFSKMKLHLAIFGPILEITS